MSSGGGGGAEDRTLIPRRDGADPEARKEQAEQIRHLQKEAFQLANYYFVFQGVIFTGFYHAPSHVKCRYKWVPLLLSLLAGILNFCALSRIALSYKSVLDDVDADADADANANANANANSTRGHYSNAFECAKRWRCFNLAGCLVIVFAFITVTLIGCWLITCADEEAAAPLSPDAA